MNSIVSIIKFSSVPIVCLLQWCTSMIFKAYHHYDLLGTSFSLHNRHTNSIVSVGIFPSINSIGDEIILRSHCDTCRENHNQKWAFYNNNKTFIFWAHIRYTYLIIIFVLKLLAFLHMHLPNLAFQFVHISVHLCIAYTKCKLHSTLSIAHYLPQCVVVRLYIFVQRPGICVHTSNLVRFVHQCPYIWLKPNACWPVPSSTVYSTICACLVIDGLVFHCSFTYPDTLCMNVNISDIAFAPRSKKKHWDSKWPHGTSVDWRW